MSTVISKAASLKVSRRSLLAGAAAVPLLAFGAAETAHAFGASHGLTPIDGSPWQHPELRSIDFRFRAQGVQVFDPSVRVTLPESYDSSPDRRYPVLLLLHGGRGMFLDWSREGNVIEATKGQDLIVVMPDGGGGSFYSNANYPLPGREAAWETFIMERVLPYVHENFRTDPSRMAIAGLSMGGWGALALGQRYYGHFRSISAYSGPSDCRPGPPGGGAVRAVIWIGPVADALNGYWRTSNLPGSTWGNEVYPEIAKGYNPMENIEKYRGKRLFIRSGDGTILSTFAPLPSDQDRILDELKRRARSFIDNFGADIQEATVHTTNERFSNALTSAGIDHDYKFLPDRTHEWGLWKECFAEDLPGMMQSLNS